MRRINDLGFVENFEMARCIANIVFGAVNGIAFWVLVALIATGLTTGLVGVIAALVALGLSVWFIRRAYRECD